MRPHDPVTLCVINFNGLAHLQTWWAALQSWHTRFDEILVVDNASDDGSVTFLQTLPGIRVLRLARNRGPAGARNLGFRLARHHRILFLDNDVAPTPALLDTLSTDLDQNPGALLVAPRVCYANAPEQIQYESADCHVLGLMSLRQANQPADQCPARLSRTTSVVTACFLIDRARWRHCCGDRDLFDERLIFNLEDHDFGVRASLLGFDLLCDSRVSVRHGAGTPGQSWRPGASVPTQRLYCLCRNRWWILLRYFSASTLVMFFPFLLAFEALQLAGFVARGQVRVWLSALGSTLAQGPTLWRERQSWQHWRQCPDREILRPGPLPLTSSWQTGSWAAALLHRYERALQRWCEWLRWSPGRSDGAPNE